jgi:CYTH domain-containing protein
MTAENSTLKKAAYISLIRNFLVTPSAQRQIRQERCQDQQRAEDQKETVRVLIQRDTTYVHAKQTCHQVNRQGQHSY